MLVKTSYLLSLSLFCLQSFAQEVLPNKAPAPADNPVTEEKVLLGKMLYFDPRLSKDGTVSCNSCHNVMAGGVDNKQFSAGVGSKLGGRNSPTVWNSAFLSVQFWDGRANSLEDQAKGPLVNPVEMAMKDHALVTDRITKITDYKPLFDKAFGPGDNLTIDNAAKAIASYERTLITPNSRFDKYLKGDKKALSSTEIKGFEKAKEVGCFSCHSGPNLAGPALPVGTGFFMKFPTFPGSPFDKKYNFLKDKGRFEATKNPADKNMFRVQSLRNVELTAPYFHNGSVATLEEAVRVMGKTQLNKDLTDEEVTNLVAFLKSLTGEFPTQTMPRLPGTSGHTIVQ